MSGWDQTHSVHERMEFNLIHSRMDRIQPDPLINYHSLGANPYLPGGYIVSSL